MVGGQKSPGYGLNLQKKTQTRRLPVTRTKLLFSICLLAATCVVPVSAQQQTQNQANVVVPSVVKFSGVLNNATGKPSSDVVGVTFSLYKDAEGGTPLWVETQNIHPDKTGRYSVMLGSSSSHGVPADLFAAGEARWLSAQPQGQSEGTRVQLMSVPYAMKALDAETLGGKPASAFMTATNNNSNSASNSITGSGKKDYLARWTSASKLGNSNVFESTSGDVGIATTAPATTLDVNGGADIRNTLTLFPSGSSPALSVNGTSFSVGSTGVVNFASGQTFSGVPSLASPNTFTANQTINVTSANAGISVTNTGSGDGIDIFNPSQAGGFVTGGQIGFLGSNNFLPIYATTNLGTSPEAILADNNTDGDFKAAIVGEEFGSSHKDIGVYGYETSINGYGVYGQSTQSANLGSFDAAGVWGDSNAGNGVMGTSAQQQGIFGLTADTLDQFFPGGYFNNSNSMPYDPVLETYGENTHGYCIIDNLGDLACSGSKSAVVPVDNGSRNVALYAIESPQNWFEDFGSGQLAHGSTTIHLETTFAQTVNTGVNYHVYLTPNGDCKGLYVSQKTPTTFEVHESGQGTSGVAFDYRVVAERKGYEQIRMADKTKYVKTMSMAAKGLLRGTSAPVTVPQAPEVKLPAQLHPAGKMTKR
jgi:hypothetical protein